MEENNQAGGSSYKMNNESKCPFLGSAPSQNGAAKQSAEVLKVTKTGGQISYN
jgi:catalase-peroxidase